MKYSRFFKTGVILICMSSFVACQNTIFKDALTLSPESLKDRRLQTRIFESTDERKLLTASAAVLQDLGYTIAETVEVVLSIALEIISVLALSPTSVPYDQTQKILASLVTTPVDNQRIAVRITFHHIVWNSDNNITKNEQINEPRIYQDFFAKLSKSVFLVAHEI